MYSITQGKATGFSFVIKHQNQRSRTRESKNLKNPAQNPYPRIPDSNFSGASKKRKEKKKKPSSKINSGNW